MKQMGVNLENARDLRDLYLDKNTGLNLLCCGCHIYCELAGFVVVCCVLPGRYSVLMLSANNVAPLKN